MNFSYQPLFFAIILLSSVSIMPMILADVKESSSSIDADQFHLKINQTASLESDNIRVKFLNVTGDSRCPSDVTCIWQGEAKIFVNIIKDNRDLGDFSLTSRTGNKDLAVQVFDGHSVEVTKIDPYPTSGKKIPISDYVATFVILKSKIASPYMQFKSGTLAKDVQCNNGLQLVIKTKDGSPACVKPSTAITLISWGWAKSIIENTQATATG